MVQTGKSLVQKEDIKSIVPTLVIGIGGTGLEVIMRIRRLITESYGSLENLPVVGFLHIDTDREAQPANPLMAGPPLENYETYCSQVAFEEARKILHDPESWSWYHDWLPPELLDKPQLLVSQQGAGQIRACGRFSFFFNHDQIGKASQQAKQRIRRGEHRTFMSEKYGLDVKPQLNVFVACSIAGGTGSGMLIDLGYSLQRWFEGESDLKITAIISTPDAFGSVSAKDKIKCNGYAALMELNYFCDTSTTFSVRYAANEGSRIETNKPPYDLIYLVGTTNESGVNLKLDDVQEMMAQNIFLDLVSDFSAYKRSIRDNIERTAAGQNDEPPKGRSYPRTFMSFGLATIEIPIHHIRNNLTYRLSEDLCQWWQNREVQLPPEPQTTIDSQLRGINLLARELRQTILRAKDRPYPYQAVIQEWISSLRQEIISENRLECTAQGINIFSQEKGKIVDFIDGYLRPQVDRYRYAHLRDDGNDERTHGDFLRVMYDNRNQLVSSAIAALQESLYTELADRHLGPKFLQLKLDAIASSFDSDIQQMEREAEKTWLVLERASFKEYEASLSRLNEHSRRWRLTKQSQMNEEGDIVLNNLGKAFNCFLERKSRVIAVAVLRRLKEFVDRLRSQLERWQQRVSQSEARFRELAKQEANQADALEMVGIKLFERQELNELYDDFLADVVNKQEGGMTSASRRGQEVLCKQLTEQILTSSSHLWKESRPANATFRLLDIEKIDELQYSDFEGILEQKVSQSIAQAGQNTRLYQDIDACTHFRRQYPDEMNPERKIQELFEQSKPLVRLNRNIPQVSAFNYISLAKAGLLGGDNPTENDAIKLAELLKKYFTDEQAIAPLTERERHKILAVHEVGGFSLRCLQGTEQMRRSYQDWRGKRITAERKRLRGQQADLSPSVHIQKDIIFWDFIPADYKVEELVVMLRALGILRQEVNQNTQQPVIRYSRKIRGETEKVTLAANWEDTVQVLQLPDCRQDKKELETQLDRSIEQAETTQQKQQIEQQLQTYLQQRLSDFRKQGGQDAPRYLRERDIVRSFIAEHHLRTTATEAVQNQSGKGEHHLGFEVNTSASSSPDSYQEYEQYLTQLFQLNLS